MTLAHLLAPLRRPTRVTGGAQVWLTLGALAASFVLGGGCAHVSPPAQGAGTELDGGYSLLHDIAARESDLDKILLLKTVSPDVEKALRRISDLFRQATAQLDRIAGEEGGVRFDVWLLPQIDQQTRAAIRSTNKRELLFSTGGEFEQRLLLGQHEALEYVAHLARVLAKNDRVPKRQVLLNRIAEECDREHKIILELLLSH